MKNSNAINWTAGVVCLAAWCGLYLWLRPHPPEVDRRPHEGLGEMLAAEAMRRLEPDGRLIVLARDAESYQVPAAATQLKSFLDAVKKAGAQTVVQRALQVDPLRVASVPPGDFLELLRQSRSNDVIVSFLGPPVLSSDQLKKLGAKRPPVLAVCAGAMPAQVDLHRLFEQDLLSSAVISRTATPGSRAAGDSRSAFAQMFQLITAANLNELPVATSGRR